MGQLSSDGSRVAFAGRGPVKNVWWSLTPGAEMVLGCQVAPLSSEKVRNEPPTKSSMP